MSDKKKGSRFAVVAENVSKLREESPTAAPTTKLKMGRPPGKKSSADYVQVTVYLRKNTHTEARKLLLDDRRQFSDLVEELVSKWTQESK